MEDVWFDEMPDCICECEGFEEDIEDDEE